MRRLLATILCLAALLTAVSTMSTGPASAIVRGTVDWSAHPSVGALIKPNGRPYCSGVLVANRKPGKVFLTSAHCLGPRGNGTRVRVTFGATTASGPIYTGIYHVMPGYVQASFANDIAVVVFTSLPRLRAVYIDDGDTWLGPGAIVTTVGYGIPSTGIRKWATEIVRRSSSRWLFLTAGSGNSCNIDSGGPDLVQPDADDTTGPEVVALTDQGTCSWDQDFRVTGAAVRHFVDNP